MNKLKKREEIINDYNSAQSVLETIIETTNFSQTNELRITTVLQGDLDFSILKTKEIMISSIFIETPGEITNLFNIPESVTVLVCNNQYLKEIKQLPLQIEKIELNNNILENFDCSQLSDHFLKELDLSFNNLKVLKNLPQSLEILNIENNQLKEINLAELLNLKTLICSNNPILVLQNVPDSLTNIVMENNPFLDVESGSEPSSEKKNDYLQCLNKYFKMKNDYENKVRQLKHNAYKKGRTAKESRVYVNDVKIPCVYCKRNVGTLFYIKDQYYVAKCGAASKPCDLDIQIFTGDYFRLETLLHEFNQSLELDKESIIMSKMDSLFKHVSDESSTRFFEETIKDYKETIELYGDVSEKYDEIYNNSEKKEKLQKQQELFYRIVEDMKKIFYEYKTSGKREILITLVETYKNELIPAVEKLRHLKYAHMYVDIHEGESKVSVLKQYPYPAHSKDYIYGEEPKVVKFVVNV